MNIASGSAAILDLKAELLRKYNNVKNKNNSEKIEPFTVRKGGFKVELRKPKVRESEHVPPADDGEEEALNESRRRLEEKARLYDAKKAEAWTEETEDSLIDFNRKRKLEQKHLQEANEDSSDSDSEWTTFEDALGRTRKCLKIDLPHYRNEDMKLTESLKSQRPGSQTPEAPASDPFVNIPLPEGPPVEATDPAEDPGKQERLQKWDEIEQQNNSKEHLHYRDVLFDEIREHGQAHFEFSRDETERAHQMKILDKLRDDSTRAQRMAQEIKKSREKIRKERMNKIRLRRGLAPEPDEPIEPTPPPPPPPPPPSQPSLRPTHSTSHIRPWDEGKEVHGVPIRLPPKRDYFEEKREERPAEFAPPTSYNDRYGRARSDNRKREDDVSEFLRNIRENI
ncbi:coiled-coil domain-containing protein 174 [Galendromus occidentalis]|uniref:Coiled-coil domain-containing protein 174 n=1 Tax=Galendromus occidentalis TaxID=34638 RepID=A0AAJ7L6W2_9ACAR|nr:coiled-coil domain-containing protein 174 [Galendromus occidentalis]